MDELNTNAKILVVEDDAMIRDYVAGLLRAAGYSVTTVPSGRAALELINAGLAPDLLFTDITIAGGMNGIEVARKAQNIVHDLKVLFMSGYAGAWEDQRPAGSGFLQKPFRRLQCIEKVQSVLSKSTTLEG
jgi:CheY-like chemotaxis protein